MEKIRKRREEIVQQLSELDEMEKRGKKLKKLIKMVRDEANGVRVGFEDHLEDYRSPSAVESVESRAAQYDRVNFEH